MRARSIHSFMLSALAVALISTLFVSGGSTQASGYTGSLQWMYASGSATGGKRVHLRIVMTQPAPEGGVNVALSSSDPSIPVPAFAHINTGDTEEVVGITTVPVINTKDVKVTAMFNGVKMVETIKILEAYHSSQSLQSRIRAGGLGKVIVRLSGRAPVGGITVNLSTTRPDVFLLPTTAFIPEGAASAVLKISATDDQIGDTNVSVTSSYSKKGKTFTKKAIVRHYGVLAPTATATNTEVPTATATNTEVPTATATNTEVPTATATNTEEPTATATNTEVPTATSTATEEPTATATNTEVPTATATETEVPTATATNTEVPTATATNTEVPTATATNTEVPTATATNTEVPTATATSTAVPAALTVSVSATNVERGSVVQLSVCLQSSPLTDVTITWAPNQDSPMLNASNYGSKTILAGATGSDLCFNVDFIGKNHGGGKPVGTSHMIFTIGSETFNSRDIHWE